MRTTPTIHGAISHAPPTIPATADSNCVCGARSSRLVARLADVSMPRHDIVTVLHDEPMRVSLGSLHDTRRRRDSGLNGGSSLPQPTGSVLILRAVVATHDSPAISLIANPESHSHIAPPLPTVRSGDVTLDDAAGPEPCGA